VKTAEVESAGLVADRIRRALEFVPAERLTVNPDCGLRHLPAEAPGPSFGRPSQEPS
jgi:5-methyltetrahydropteroyltriglutamate--homocysteine methyltransferase